MTKKIEQAVINEFNNSNITFDRDEYGNIIVARKERKKMELNGWCYNHKKKTWNKDYPLKDNYKEIAYVFA